MMNTPTSNTELPLNRGPDGITRGLNGVLAEPPCNGMLPRPGVRSARAETRNLRTGVRFQGLPAPAPVSQVPNYSNDPQTAPSEDLDNGEGGWDELLEAIEIEETLINNVNEDLENEGDDFFTQTTDNPRRQRLPPRRSNAERIQGPTPSIKVGSLNMRGRKCTTGGSKNKDKFNIIKKWMRENDITILTLIDTHWDVEYERELSTKTKALQIFCSHETSIRGGVAFVVDVSKWKPTETKFTCLIEGRSAALQVKYARDELTIATVYVPNRKEDKIEVIRTLRNKLRDLPNSENLILTGDFNMVENEIDRRPTHPDDPEIVNEMTRLKVEMNLVDGWRLANPEEYEHTWSGHTNDDVSYARIDRIYASESLFRRTNEWEIVPTTKPLTDHSGVVMRVLEPEAPFIGKGERRFNLSILDHQHFRTNATIALTKLEEELEKYHTKAGHVKRDQLKLNKLRERINPQVIWTEYKKRIMILSKEASEIRRKNILRERHELERRRRALIHRPAEILPESIQKEIRKEIDAVERELSQLTECQQTKADDTMSAKWFGENERGSKAWYALNKERKSAQIFYALRDSNGRETRNTDEMEEIAKLHHQNLQSAQAMTPEREEAIDRILSKVKQKISDSHSKLLAKKITYDEIKNTIKSSKNGKSPGCDGIPNEVWKDEIKTYEKSKKEGERRPDLAKLLKFVLLDVDEHGPIDHSFAEARMSLLYKKKDIRDIANYRPITLLNTDYKIYTTILTKRLREAAPSIINADQAGFMPKRNIYDQTKLLELMIKLCENKNQNGIIQALDQEKAYDRIDHSYLWKAMKRYGIPHTFLRRVQRLYSNAKTAIRINGCTTDLFDIQRGVRQGDPLSCLLYNIAIEPLFESIRLSTLKGLKVSDDSDNALVNAYADDTTIYLSETDSHEELNRCLDEFCLASTAQFNKQKTEIIPVGSPEYRREVKLNRRFNGSNIEQEVKIAEDGEPIRILGSWQGNNVNANHKWIEIIEAQLTIMKRWARTFPSILARARVAKALIVSRALYLMMVNGIPEEYLKVMEKNIRDFIWLGKRGPISWDRAIRNKRDGGIGAPSITTLNEATKIMWLKRWMTPDDTRPKWAWAANEILVGTRVAHPTVDPMAVTEWVEQKWKSKIKVDAIPQSLRAMLRAAKRYNLKISVVRAPMALKLQMPAFSHPGRKTNRKENTKRSKCLKNFHAVSSTGDLAIFARGEQVEDEDEECPLGSQRCREYARDLLLSLGDVWNPETASPIKHQNYHTPRRIKLYADANIKNRPIEYNPDPLDSETARANARIFGGRIGYLKNPKAAETPRKPLRIARSAQSTQATRARAVYTSVDVKNNGWENSQAYASNWHSRQSPGNCTRKLSGQTQTRLRAELAAILLALKQNRNHKLMIKSTSLPALKAVCHEASKWEDKLWHKTPNDDIIRAIVHELRTRPATCSFQWVRTTGETADPEAILARKHTQAHISDEPEMKIEPKDYTNTRALHDGARISALEMRDAYSIILDLRTSKTDPFLHPERLEIAKASAEEATGKRPTTQKIIAGVWNIAVYPRLRDLLWNSLFGRLRIGEYWLKIEGFEQRARCKACEDNEGTDTTESEIHMWLMCENNGQLECWQETKRLWIRCTSTAWPNVNIGTIWGLGAWRLTNENRGTPLSTDSERFGIMAALALWAIWKSRNERAMRPDVFTSTQSARSILKEALKDAIKKSWIATKFESEKRRPKRENHIQALWGNGSLAILKRDTSPTFNF